MPLRTLAAAGVEVAVNYVDGDEAAHEVVKQIAALGVRAVAPTAHVSNEVRG